jgi:hypothetical protein
VITHVWNLGARTFVTSLVTLSIVVLASAPAWAAPSIQQVTANPAEITLNVTTNVKITAVIANNAEILVGAFALERFNAQGTPRIINLLNDLGLAGDAVRGDGIQTVVQRFRESESGPITLRIDGVVFLKTAPRVPVRLTSETFTVTVGAALPTAGGGTIPGQGGTQLIVSPNTFTAPMLVGIAPVPASTVTGDLGNFTLVAGVQITAQPIGYTGGLGPAEEPLNISVPLPAGVTDTEFIVGEQVLMDSFNPPGLKVQFLARAMAEVQSGRIVTVPSALKGIQQGGVHAILGAIGSAVVSGTVFEPGGGPAAGVVVSNNTNTAVDVTDANGQYSIFVSGTGPGGTGAFTITAFHPFQGSSGSAAGAIVTHGTPIPGVNITLVPLVAPPITRDGIRNAGFELCTRPDTDGHGNLAGTWTFTGVARAVTHLTSTTIVVDANGNPLPEPIVGTTILPTEGKCMVDFDTSDPAVGQTASSLTQKFIVPAGVTSLKFDFNFVSEEFPEFVGTQFNDVFRALITTPNGQQQLVAVQVNDFVPPNDDGFQQIGDCGFPGGDNTCGQTGWQTASINLSQHAGTGTPVEVTILFTVTDAGDNIYDTHILIDNLRFGTVWVDAKILDGANANQAGIEEEIRVASEILSQAGLIVRLRPTITTLNTNTPGYTNDLLDPNLDYVTAGPACVDQAQRNGIRTAEEVTLLGLARSATNTDVNLYYARTATRTDGALISGYAIGPDEYCNEVNLLTNSGLLLMNRRLQINSPGILGHEIGHLLISPHAAPSTLEHNAGSTNFMNGTGTLATAIVGRNQSAVIMRPTAPLVDLQ